MTDPAEIFPRALLLPWLAYAFTVGQLMEWWLIRQQGTVGRSKGFGAIIDFSAGLGGLFGFVLLAAYGFDFGWTKALILFGVQLALIPLQLVIRAAFPKPALFALWMVSLCAFYVALFYFASRLSWFGTLAALH